MKAILLTIGLLLLPFAVGMYLKDKAAKRNAAGSGGSYSTPSYRPYSPPPVGFSRP